MNPEWAAELAELVALARASADDSWTRGMRDDAGELLPPTSLADAPAPSSGSAVASSAWSSLAQEAREADRGGAAALARVRDDLGDCRRCGLCSGRRSLVFGVGDPDADLVVVGEAPGRQEDVQGEPFVGPSGQMLDKMLSNVIGLEREQVYILNVVKCHPPQDRNPLPDEVEACRPFLEAQIAAIRPKVLLVLGGVAFKALFRTQEGITRSRGQWRPYGGVPTMPTFHPAYLLRKPEDKRLTFADLKAVRGQYDALHGRR